MAEFYRQFIAASDAPSADYNALSLAEKQFWESFEHPGNQTRILSPYTHWQTNFPHVSLANSEYRCFDALQTYLIDLWFAKQS